MSDGVDKLIAHFFGISFLVGIHRLEIYPSFGNRGVDLGAIFKGGRVSLAQVAKEAIISLDIRLKAD